MKRPRYCFVSYGVEIPNTPFFFNLTECNSKKFNVLMYLVCLEISSHFHIDEFVSLT